MHLQESGKFWQKLLHAVMLHLIVVPEVRGYRLDTKSIYAGSWWGYLCSDPTPVRPTCGWMILVTSNPPLSSLNVNSWGKSEIRSGQEFYISNVSYSGTAPNTTIEFCLDSSVTGSFGNTPPSYITLSWYCICVTSTSTANAATTGASSTLISSSACKAPPDRTTTTQASTTTTTAQPLLAGRPRGGGFFIRHAGKCYISSLEKSDLTYKLLCLYACLIESACNGVKVEAGGYADRCTFVTPNVVDASQLANSDICDFWEKQ